jgi:opacity protein-like surface antigen
MYALPLLVSLLSLGSDPSPDTKPPSNPISSSKGYYIGVFGGGGSSNAFDVEQKGTALYPSSKGGPLSVNAQGNGHNDSLGFVGLHLGYEWLPTSQSKWYFTHALEVEGYYESTKKKATLTNPTDRLDLHQFKDTFPINMGVMLANWIIVLNNKSFWNISPYIGVGVGAGILSIHNAKSSQVAPPEPGINHFNSDPNASDWVFATQGKAGLRFGFFKHMRFFAEYRFLYLTSSDYTFGSTKYPTHVATTKWKVDFGGICNNMYVFGIDFPW